MDFQLFSLNMHIICKKTFCYGIAHVAMMKYTKGQPPPVFMGEVLWSYIYVDFTMALMAAPEQECTIKGWEHPFN